MRPVADRLGVKVTAFNLDNDVGTSLEAAQEAGVHGLLVGADPSFFVMRDLIVAEMTKRRIPAIYSVREYVLAGGLMSYARITPSLVAGRPAMWTEFSRERIRASFLSSRQSGSSFL
jgi:hypothetical protein